MAVEIMHNQTALDSLFHALDPISLLLSHNPLLSPQSESTQFMERGPRYEAYAQLRESRLRSKYTLSSPYQETEDLPEMKPTPTKKQVKFQSNIPTIVSRKKGPSYSAVAQSVPDFSAVLRREKENRKPPTRPDMTPPRSKGNIQGVLSSSRGSKSANAGEKKCSGLMGRKSYASLEELKGFSSAAANAIVGENRVGRVGRATPKAVLGYRF